LALAALAVFGAYDSYPIKQLKSGTKLARCVLHATVARPNRFPFLTVIKRFDQIVPRGNRNVREKA